MTNDYRPPGGIMFTRIVMLMLIAMLAFPVTTLTPPGESHQAPWSQSAVAAKGKKQKHKHHKKVKTATRTIRQPMTQTFTSTQAITIPNGAPTTDKGPATPYPSAIAVSGLTNGTITDVNLILTDLTHQHHDDLDILLSASNGRQALVMSDVGDASNVADIDLILDDEAAASMPYQGGTTSDLSSGTYRPTDIDRSAVTGPDTFAAPAPAPDGHAALSTFDGANPNETWQLWVMDNNGGDYGDLTGWALQITAEVDVQVPDQVKTKHKKHKKHGKKRR
jgi:subtilisin-like proprotein convertase family protein